MLIHAGFNKDSAPHIQCLLRSLKINIHVGDFQVGCLYLSSFLDVTEYSIFAFDIFIKLFGLNRENFSL